MMKTISSFLVILLISSLFLTVGCETVPEKDVSVALSFKPKDAADYKVVTVAKDGISFAGSLKGNPDFMDRMKEHEIEIVFTQEIESVDSSGNAAARITIRQLKYTSNEPAIEFDSAGGAGGVFSRLIGQSYRIQLAPNGAVLKVIDAEEIREAVKGGSTEAKAAMALVSTSTIKQRHGSLILSDAEQGSLAVGQTWSSLESFNFGLMGTKAYERVYTLNEIAQSNGGQVGIVAMEAIPSVEQAEELHKQDAQVGMLERFDATDSYIGKLEMDLISGEVLKYSEQLTSQWLAIDPEADTGSEQEPDSLTMKAMRSYSIEKLN